MAGLDGFLTAKPSRPARLGILWLPLGVLIFTPIILVNIALLVTLRILYVIVYLLGEL